MWAEMVVPVVLVRVVAAVVVRLDRAVKEKTADHPRVVVERGVVVLMAVRRPRVRILLLFRVAMVVPVTAGPVVVPVAHAIVSMVLREQ